MIPCLHSFEHSSMVYRDKLANICNTPYMQRHKMKIGKVGNDNVKLSKTKVISFRKKSKCHLNKTSSGYIFMVPEI